MEGHLCLCETRSFNCSVSCIAVTRACLCDFVTLGLKTVYMCRFCFCRYHGMVPLRFIPMAPYAMTALLSRFTAAADKKALHREMRSGSVFGRMTQAQLIHNGHENRTAIANNGQWSLNCSTFQTEYCHPAFLNAIFGDLVCPHLQYSGGPCPCQLLRNCRFTQ